MNLSNTALQKLLATCPRCLANFDQLESNVIRETIDAKLLHVRCRTCQNSLVALLFSTGPLISSIGVPTDLSREDAIQFQLAEDISEDDVFALHEWLQRPSALTDLMKHVAIIR